MTLRPWSRSYLAARLDALNALRPASIDRIVVATGGWNEPCHTLFKAATASPGRILKLVESAASDLITGADILTRLGIRNELLPIFRNLAPWAADDALSVEYFNAICRQEQESADPAIVGNYASHVGILSFAPDDATKNLDARVDMNPLAIAALKMKAPTE